MSNAGYQKDYFNLRINTSASVKEIFDAWTTRCGLEKWFLRKAEFKTPEGKLRNDDETVCVGDSYTWLWHGYGDEIAEHGTVLEINGKDFFKFQFGKAGNVTITITQEENENIVALLQSEIPSPEIAGTNFHYECTVGWTFYLTNLKSVLEHGTDLRNKNEKIKQVVSA